MTSFFFYISNNFPPRYAEHQKNRSLKKENYKQLDDCMSDSQNLAYDPVSLLEISLTYVKALTNFLLS